MLRLHQALERNTGLLIFGILVSTVLTLVVIPLLYFVAYRRNPAPPVPPLSTEGAHV